VRITGIFANGLGDCMTGLTIDERGTDGTVVKKAWGAPTLTTLGDAATLTQLGGAPTPDATGGS
jgi:hypothetical protein